MKRIYILLLSIICLNSFSQANFLQWAHGIGAANADAAHSVVADSAGNVYTVGSFSGTVDFDPGPGTFELTSAGGMFIAKYDRMGNILWAKSIEGTAGNQYFMTGLFKYSIALDKYAQVFITGLFGGTVDFDPSASTYNLTASSNYIPFVLKLSNAGNFIWVRKFDKTSTGSDNAFATGIKVDANGNVITCGIFNGIYDFNPGSGTNTLNANTTFQGDSYVSKLDSMGNFVWVKGFVTATSTEYNLKALDIDNAGSIYVGGSYYSAFNSAYSDYFLAKLDNAGTTMWTKQGYMGSSTTQGDGINSISLDGANNLFVTGYFNGTVNFNANGGTYNLTTLGGYDIFVSKFNSFGNWLWTKQVGGTNNDQGYAIQANTDGTAFCTGEFLSTSIDFDPGAGVQTLNAVAGKDVFLLKLDAAGAYVWAKTLGGFGDETGAGLTVDDGGNILMTGIFNSVTDFDPDAGVYNLSANGSTDGFLLKLTNCIYNEPDICLVTVDSLANNNVIYWDKTQFPLADSFIVYRYDAFTTNYLRIGAVAAIDTNSFLVDTARSVAGPNGGDPQYSSSRYKLAIRGICGDLGTMGKYHESIFIQQNFQNFSWNAYAIENQTSPVTGYQFSRDNNGTGNWQVLVNTGSLATTDPNYASYPNGRWRVDALGFACTSGVNRLANGAYEIMGAINTSRSNIKSPTSIGLHELNNKLPVKVYPNPASTQFVVEFPSMSESATIEVRNALGQVVYRQLSSQLLNAISCEGLEPGIYFVHVQSGKGRAVHKVTISN